MKKILFNYVLTAAVLMACLSGCSRDSDYLNGTVSPFIANFDLRKLHAVYGEGVILTTELTRGATMVRGQVISDHSTNNMPEGLLVLQNSRMVGNGIDSLRGIAINIGADAAQYVPGDSVHVAIEGTTLARVNGILQITGVNNSNVTKVASGTTVPLIRRLASEIRTTPDWFDCTQVTITKATYYPTLDHDEVIAGDKTLNDGTENVWMYTEANASFANLIPPYSGNYTGVLFNIHSDGGTSVAQHRIRSADDIMTLSSTVDVPEFVITGYSTDPPGGDANYEYIQFRATQDINFSVTPFSVVTSNSAGTSTPLGFTQLRGWVTGDLRSYKFELTAGAVSKGEFFYVGGAMKLINGPGSTSMASSKWIVSLNYNATGHTSPEFYPGGPRGSRTSNLLANSGNAAGIAVFRGLEVQETSVPIDVVWTATANVYQENPQVGFRIGNTDHYDVIEPLTGASQPFYRSGANTASFAYVATADINKGWFLMMGGVFDTTLNKWVQARRTGAVATMVFAKPSPDETASIGDIENELSTEIR